MPKYKKEGTKFINIINDDWINV